MPKIKASFLMGVPYMGVGWPAMIYWKFEVDNAKVCLYYPFLPSWKWKLTLLWNQEIHTHLGGIHFQFPMIGGRVLQFQDCNFLIMLWNLTLIAWCQGLSMLSFEMVFDGFFHGKLPWNHQCGEYVLFFPTALSKSKYPQNPDIF